MFVHQNLVGLPFSQELLEDFVVVVAVDDMAADFGLLEVDVGSLGRR